VTATCKSMILVGCLAGLSGTILQTLSSLAADEDRKDATSEKKPKGKFTIGKDTTFVDGPLDKDGYIDYVAALNERLRQAVTPENNANVLIWKALGPHPDGATMPRAFFPLMGIQAPPEQGEYFVELSRYVRDHVKAEPEERSAESEDQVKRAMRRPWTEKQYPLLAAWLTANEKPLAVIVEALTRSHYYSPTVLSDSVKEPTSMVGASMPCIQDCRRVGTALVVRSMLRIGQGRNDDAWHDLLACHQLGRLIARGATAIEFLVGKAIDGGAVQADIAFLEHAKPSAKQIEKCLADLRQLSPFDLADKVDLGERFVALEAIMLADSGGFAELEKIMAPDPVIRQFKEMDWDPALRDVNRWYDRLSSAMREKDRSVREKKLDEIEADARTLEKETTVQPRKKGLDAVAASKRRSDAIRNSLIPVMIPLHRKMQKSVDVIRQTDDNLIFAFALAWYRRDHSDYPKELRALAPKYLKTIPKDLFSGKALIYRPDEKGYLLYSVGVNGKDDEGRGADDDPRGDDLSVRIPLPELQK
jgi:hypothetical protein